MTTRAIAAADDVDATIPDEVTATARMLKLVEDFLNQTPTRQMFSCAEVQNFLLECHAVLAPLEPEKATV